MNPASTSNLIYDIYKRIPAPIRNSVRPLARKFRPLAFRGKKGAITPAQRKFWKDNGYLTLERFFSPSEIQAVNDLIDQLWATRKTDPNFPDYTVDVFLGTERERRIRLRNAPDESRETNYKLYNLYLESEVIRRIVLSNRLNDVLWALLEEEPLCCNTINFEYGSEQEYHFDTFYMPPPEKDRLVASWIALEEITAGSGPLRYVPGSHKIPPYIFKKSGSTVASYDEMPAVRKYIEEEMQQRGLEEKVFTGGTGDVFIWHAQLLHGGNPITDSSATRKSLVTHYWRSCDIAPSSIFRDDRGMAFYQRDHHETNAETA